MYNHFFVLTWVCFPTGEKSVWMPYLSVKCIHCKDALNRLEIWTHILNIAYIELACTDLHKKEYYHAHFSAELFVVSSKNNMEEFPTVLFLSAEITPFVSFGKENSKYLSHLLSVWGHDPISESSKVSPWSAVATQL